VASTGVLGRRDAPSPKQTPAPAAWTYWTSGISQVFTDEIGRDSGIRFHHDVHEIDLPALVARLVFHIARKA